MNRALLVLVVGVLIASCREAERIAGPFQGPLVELPRALFAVAATGTETQITTLGGSRPAIDGDVVVWQDTRVFGQTDVYEMDLTTMTESMVAPNAGGPDVSGSQIVYRSGGFAVAHGIGTISSLTPTDGPHISGNLVSWDSGIRADGGFQDVFVYDLTTGTETNITDYTTLPAVNQTNTDVSGNHIVWLDDRHGRQEVYLFDYVSMTEMRITNHPAHKESVAIDGDRIVWRDTRTGSGEVWMYTISSSTLTQVTSGADVNAEVHISGDRIVYTSDRNPSDDLLMHDLSDGVEYIISDAPGDQNGADISGNRIVWQDDRTGQTEVFMFEIDDSGPETPSERIDDIIDEVEDVVDANGLPPAVEDDLLAPLEQSKKKLDKGKPADAIRALSRFTHRVREQEDLGEISSAEADALVAATADAIKAIADGAGRTFVCHIKKSATVDGVAHWQGKVQFMPNTQVPAHCSPHGKFGIPDHNPVVGNLGIGNFCGRQQVHTGLCEVGGIGG